MRVKRLLITVACVATLGCGRSATEAPEPSAVAPNEAVAHDDDGNTIEVEASTLRDLRVTKRRVEARVGGDRVVLLGEVSVDHAAYAEVGTPVAARAIRVPVNAGDAVAVGQVLAEVTSAELGRARAEYLSLAARLRLAEATLERKRALAEEKVAPLREVQEAESAAAEARAALRAARAAVAAFGVAPPSGDSENETSSVFLLRAPIAGTVIERSLAVGQMLDPAVPAFRIGNLSSVWLIVHAFEGDAVRIASESVARVSFPALPGQDFEGRVASVGHQVESQSRTVPVRIVVKNNGGLLRPGMSATATVPVGVKGGSMLTVPVAAVQRVRNEWSVFVPKDATHFEVRRIGRGRDLGSEVEVLSGLVGGETVVMDGAFLLKAQAEKREGDHDAH